MTATTLFTPKIRQIRLERVTFSFHIFEEQSVGIGEELIFVVRKYQKNLETALEGFKLPKLVRIMISASSSCLTSPSNAVGEFGGPLPFLSRPFHININTEVLHEEEQSGIWEKHFSWKGRLLWVFFHELAHFTTIDEKEANKMAFEAIRLCFQDQKKPAAK